MSSLSSINTASVSASDPTNQALQQQMQAARKAAMDAAAKSLNMTTPELQQQLQSGKSLKDVAAASGVDFSKVQSAITSAVKPQLDQAVQSGTITSQQANNTLTRLTSGDAAGKVHRGHHHHGAPPAAPSSPDTTSTSAAADELALLASPNYSASGTATQSSAATGQVVNQTA